MRSYLSLVILLSLATPALAGPAPEWTVMRAQVGDQTEEWSQQGYLPAWDVKIGAGEAPTIEIGGDQAGAYRGTVLVGRRWRVPAPLPAVLRVRLRYQTYCAMDDPKMPRAGQPRLAFFTPERWSAFAADPKRAEKWDTTAADPGVVAIASIHASGEDVTEWRDWESTNLAPRLRGREGQELVLAIAWSAMHFHAEEWAKFAGMEVRSMSETDLERELLEKLDLARPDLGAVKDALARDDLRAAKAALVAHFRARPKPVGPPLRPDGSERGIQAADEILEHVFRFVGCPPTKLEPAIRWNEDPHNYEQWAIAFNRHTHWVTLGRAYAATKDEKYAREFVAQLNGWVAAMPVHIGRHWVQGPYFEEGKSPLSLDAGIRMGQSWWPVYAYFKDSPAFDVESQFRMIRSFYEHALYLMDRRAYRASSNWGAMETNGLFHLGVMLPEFRESGEWLRTAQERLVESYKAQVYPDGAQIELAPGYHGVTLGNYLGALDLARLNDLALSPELVAGLERMFEYYVAIAAPDGRMPALNDSGWGSVRSMLAQGFELFAERRDFQYLATAGKEGTPPAQTSWAMPHAGWYVMRTGWGADDRYLHFEAGPYGGGHQHEDKLSLILHAGGKPVLTEGGVYGYDTSDWRRYVLSARAHNVVMVDGQEQNRRTQRDTFVQWQPEERRWVTDADFDYAEGVYDSGFGADNAVKVAHHRQVIFVKPDYWVVIDTMVPEDDAPHRYEALFHLDAEDAVVDAGTRSVTVESEGHGFRILPLRAEGLQVEIVKGQKEPVQGWLPTGRHNELRPIPTAVYRWTATGPSTVAYALLPRRPGEAWPVEAAGALPGAGPGEVAAELRRLGGGSDVVIRRAQGAAEATFGAVKTDAEVYVERRGAGKVLRIGGK